MVSNHGMPSTTPTGPHASPVYYRYIFQPDYVPYVLLVKALADQSVEVMYEHPQEQADVQSNVIHISTASSSEGVGRSLYVRHWTFDASTFLPLKSSVCLQSISASGCHIPIEDTYDNYQLISGVLSPSVVTSQVGNQETFTYTITGIDFSPGFTANHFTVDGANVDAK